jgi:hypothetical protein
MSKIEMYLSNLAVLTLIVGLGGCAKQDQPDAQPSVGAEQSAAQDSGGGSGAQPGAAAEASGTTDRSEADPEFQEQLAKLSDEDRALAEKQRICPVSDEPLGSMGVPVKVTVKGQDVFLCCAGCKDAIEENPDEYLAKVQ